jgi:hypothetical protein
MKKLIVLLQVTFVSFLINSQITLEKSYSDNQGLSIIKLEKSGYKYSQYDLQNKILKLYNLDHTIFKTINLPTLPQEYGTDGSIAYISETLFNTDNKVELLVYSDSWGPKSSNQNSGSLKVINEDGTVIFNGDSMRVVENRSTNLYGYNDNSQFIYNTTNGTKMILWSYKKADTGFKVFSLPGTLIASLNETTIEQKNSYLPYPNPTNSYLTIPYELTKSNAGLLTIYDAHGRQIELLQIDNNFKNVFIDISKFQNGYYNYTISNKEEIIDKGKFLVSK